MSNFSNEPNGNSGEAIQQATPPECIIIEQLLADPLYSIVTWLHILITATTLALIAYFIRLYSKVRIPFHGNFLLLILNLVLSYTLNSLFWIVFMLRYKYLLMSHKGSCELLTPVWLAITLTSFSYLYVIANTGIHFSIMLERVRATIFVRHYEREGLAFGIWTAIVTWTLSICYTIWVIYYALADQSIFGKPLGLVSLTSKYNANGIIYSYYLAIAFSLITAFGDCVVIKLNRHIKERRANAVVLVMTAPYSLSANFQLNENLLSMGLMLPLDISYAFLFGIYTLAGALLRSNRQLMSNNEYIGYYYSANILPFLHMAISMFIYIMFVTKKSAMRRGRTVSGIEPMEKLGQMYFRQLEQQWNH